MSARTGAPLRLGPRASAPRRSRPNPPSTCHRTTQHGLRRTRSGPNRWQAEALPHAIERELPSGARIRAVSPPYLLATKLEAFKGRGRADFLGSRDFADIVALFDGRAELAAEVAAAPQDVRRYLRDEVRRLLDTPRLLDGLAGAMRPDAASQQRVDDVILRALHAIADQAQRR
jgi:predicted nucleotidyltransferase